MEIMKRFLRAYNSFVEKHFFRFKLSDHNLTEGKEYRTFELNDKLEMKYFDDQAEVNTFFILK